MTLVKCSSPHDIQSFFWRIPSRIIFFMLITRGALGANAAQNINTR